MEPDQMLGCGYEDDKNANVHNNKLAAAIFEFQLFLKIFGFSQWACITL